MQKRASTLCRRMFVVVASVALLVFSPSWPEQGATKGREYEGDTYQRPGRVGPNKGTPSVCIRSLQLSETLSMELTSRLKENDYYAKVHSLKNLKKAWQKVYDSGVKSKSAQTRREIIKFNELADNKLEQIYRQLLRRNYTFKPSIGIPIPRSKKKHRPIVKSQIPDRIVQRSILNVLQETPPIRDYIAIETSFGGIEKRRVRDAIRMAYFAMQNGARWYLRSDIKDFFTNIPKDKVLKTISQLIVDPAFNELLGEAVRVELENLAELGSKKNLFPIYEIGVAQGCCLSPLIGNILLHEFDASLNGRGIICLRYVDDFIILGPSSAKVRAAFYNAKERLSDLGLNVYDPFIDKEKAKFGQFEGGVEFLGCEIRPGLIRPSKKARMSFLKKIEILLRDNARHLTDPSKAFSEGKSAIQTLTDVSNIIQGWGNQYSFCNDFALMEELDRKIAELIASYFKKYNRAKEKNKNDPLNLRRLLGMQSLSDCKSEPII